LEKAKVKFAKEFTKISRFITLTLYEQEYYIDDQNQFSLHLARVPNFNRNTKMFSCFVGNNYKSKKNCVSFGSRESCIMSQVKTNKYFKISDATIDHLIKDDHNDFYHPTEGYFVHIEECKMR
jgi:hypothetical protein